VDKDLIARNQSSSAACPGVCLKGATEFSGTAPGIPNC
jgi:hypothetical protein